MLTRDDEVVGSVLFGAAAPFESSFARKFVADEQLDVPLVEDFPTVTPGRAAAFDLPVIVPESDSDTDSDTDDASA